jgi:predicted acetyltransferase
MSIEYRAVRVNEEPEAMRLWTSIFPVPEPFFQTLMDVQEDRTLDQTRVAHQDGKIVSALHVFYRQNRGLGDRILKMGAIGSVATYEEARKQGHSGRLLQDVIELMERDGCDWSLLFTGVNNHYARYGWKTIPTYSRHGELRDDSPVDSRYEVETITDPWDLLPELKRIYDAFNTSRPLSTVRTLRAWQTAIYYRMGPASGATTFLARRDGQLVGYAVVKNGQDSISIEEVGCLPGEDESLIALLDAASVKGREVGKHRLSAMLPNEPAIDAALESVTRGLTREEHGYVMARPIGDRMTMADVEALFAAPGAIHWSLDNF